MILYTGFTQEYEDLYISGGIHGYGDNGKIIVIDGKRVNCIKAYLSYEDFPHSQDSKYIRAEIDVNPERCYVAEGAYACLDPCMDDNIVNYYNKSIVKINNYRIGTYIAPECLVVSDDIAGIPVRICDDNANTSLYGNALQTYYEARIANLSENNEDYLNKALYYYCMSAVKEGKAKRFDYEGWKYIMFILTESNERNKILIKKRGKI